MIPDICSMHILLAAATTFEIQPTIDAVCRTPTGIPHRTEVLITGVGGIATTWSLMRQIDRARPDLVIQAGIAGCLRERKPGEVLAIDEDRLADLGVWEDGRFKTLFDMRLADGDATPFTGGGLPNPYRRLLALTGLGVVGGLTINEITTDAERIRWYQQNTPAVVESMEGGPLHYVCLQEQLPFLQLRSISNAVGVRDKSKWDIHTAITRLNERLLTLLGNPLLTREILVQY